MVRNRTPAFRSTEQISGFIAWATAALVSSAVFFAFNAFFPQLGIFFPAILSVCLFVVITVSMFRWSTKRAMAEKAAAGEEYRAMMAAENQKNIDEMLGNNSNIPMVSKE